jgi:hypothetical protein
LYNALFAGGDGFSFRKASFIQHPIYGDLTSSSYFGFVIDASSDSTEFTYDADSQKLLFTLHGKTDDYLPDCSNETSSPPRLDAILIHRTAPEQSSYTGSNAFGAKVSVQKSYSKEYGITFTPDNSLFGSATYGLKFTYSIPMSSEKAKSLKTGDTLRTLVVCWLVEPWCRQSVSGHDPTIDNPMETLVGQNYL